MKLFTKGFATSLFKWIFAVVAGVLVLTFFIGFASQQQRTADVLDDRKIISGLEHQLEALSVAEVASKIIPLPKETTLHFDCDGMQGGSFRKSTSKIIFAPFTLQGTALTTWVMHWSFPFKADTFYYLSNKDTRLLLIYDVSTFSYVRDLAIPRSFNVQLMDVNNFDPASLLGAVQGLTALTLVFFTPQSQVTGLFQQFPNVPLTVVVVNPATSTATVHTATTVEDVYYLGESMLYGLFFAPAQYSCLQEKTLDHFKDVIGIYEQKTDLLRSKTGSDPYCQQLLSEGKQLLSGYKQAQSPEQLHDYALSLTQINRDLEQHDCPTIY